jgi:hypothetical protein
MDKTYGFKLLNEDSDLKEKLESMQAGERSSFIRNALRFYMNCGDEIAKMSRNIEEIMHAISTGTLPASQLDEPPITKSNESDKTDEDDIDVDKILRDSIQDIINM